MTKYASQQQGKALVLDARIYMCCCRCVRGSSSDHHQGGTDGAGEDCSRAGANTCADIWNAGGSREVRRGRGGGTEEGGGLAGGGDEGGGGNGGQGGSRWVGDRGDGGVQGLGGG